jgi:glucose/mannose transport system permease protein
VFTLVFVGGALVLGWFLAFLMEKGLKGEGVGHGGGAVPER